MVPTLQKLSELYGDISGCHESCGPLLAFSGWELGRPNVLQSIWLFHIKKCCPKCQQRENRWKKINYYKKNKGNGQPTGKHQCLLQRFKVVKDTIFSVTRLWSRVSHRQVKKLLKNINFTEDLKKKKKHRIRKGGSKLWNTYYPRYFHKLSYLIKPELTFGSSRMLIWLNYTYLGNPGESVIPMIYTKRYYNF